MKLLIILAYFISNSTYAQSELDNLIKKACEIESYNLAKEIFSLYKTSNWENVTQKLSKHVNKSDIDSFKKIKEPTYIEAEKANGQLLKNAFKNNQSNKINGIDFIYNRLDKPKMSQNIDKNSLKYALMLAQYNAAPTFERFESKTQDGNPHLQIEAELSPYFDPELKLEAILTIDQINESIKNLPELNSRIPLMISSKKINEEKIIAFSLAQERNLITNEVSYSIVKKTKQNWETKTLSAFLNDLSNNSNCKNEYLDENKINDLGRGIILKELESNPSDNVLPSNKAQQL
jgi:hypothetical protein